MPTSKACSQLQCHRPLKAKLWWPARRTQSKAGSSGGVLPSAPNQANSTPLVRAPDSCAGARAAQRASPTGSAGVSRQRPSTANFQPWNGQRSPSPSWRPNARSAPRCGQSRSSRPQRALARRGTAPGPGPTRARAFTGRVRHARVEHRIELVEQRHRLPVAAHQCAARRARADAGDQFVLRRLHATSLVAVSRARQTAQGNP